MTHPSLLSLGEHLQANMPMPLGKFVPLPVYQESTDHVPNTPDESSPASPDPLQQGFRVFQRAPPPVQSHAAQMAKQRSSQNGWLEPSKILLVRYSMFYCYSYSKSAGLPKSSEPSSGEEDKVEQALVGLKIAS